MSNIDKMFQALNSLSSEEKIKINESEKQLRGRIGFTFNCKVDYVGKLQDGVQAKDVAKAAIDQRVPQSLGASMGITSYPLAHKLVGPVLKKTKSTPQMVFNTDLVGNDLEIFIGIKMQGRSLDGKQSKPLNEISKQIGKNLSDLTVNDIEKYLTDALKESLQSNLPKLDISVGISENGKVVATLQDIKAFKEGMFFGDEGEGKYVGSVNLSLKSMNVIPSQGNSELLDAYKTTQALKENSVSSSSYSKISESDKTILEIASSVDTYAKKINDLSSVEAADKLEDEISKKARQLSDEVARPMNERAADKELSIDERVTAFRKYLEAEKESSELDELVGRKGPFMKKYVELTKK